MKPIIGIVSYPYYDKDNTPIFQVGTKIVNFINLSHGIPFIIPATNIDNFYRKDKINLKSLTKEELIDLKEALSICDGIIKPGSYFFFPFQTEICKYALEKDIPYLGICNGMQLMYKTVNKNARMLPNENSTHNDSYHEVKIYNNTLLHEILGKNRILVRSFHKYHIPSNDNFKINAVSDDGIIEGIEYPLNTYNLSVQWHPEYDLDDENSKKIFESFIESSKKHIKRK